MRHARALKLKADYAAKEIKDFQAEATNHSEQVKTANTIKNTDRLLEMVSKKADGLRGVLMPVLKQELEVVRMEVLGICKQCEEPLILPILLKSAVAPPTQRGISTSRKGKCDFAAVARPQHMGGGWQLQHR